MAVAMCVHALSWYGSVCTTHAPRHLADLCVPAASTDGRRQSRRLSLCSLRGPAGALDSDVCWPAQLCCVRSLDLEPTWNRLATAVRSPEQSLASFKRQLKTHSSVPALDNAGCSCGCRVPSSGAVVTVQRVRRRLQISRLDSTV